VKFGWREAGFGAGAAAVFWLFCRGVLGLEHFGTFTGSYGLYFNSITVGVRHITNVATAVNFDFRGFDTMGEEYILFGALIGTSMLLREMHREMREAQQQERTGRDVEHSHAVRFLGLVLTAILVLFGIYIVVHAHLTPGGGFQGGAMIGTGSLIVYLASSYEIYERLSPPDLMQFGHAAGAGLYVAIGLLGLIVGGSFLQNFLPFGTVRQFASGGTIPLINATVGLEVAAGFAAVFREFLLQTHRHNE
jgi:multicomponent Na+:H+ antiporter subunit B